MNLQMARFIVALILCLPLTLAKTDAQDHQPGHTWDYGQVRGPSHWGDLEQDFAACKNGHQQSPIDIRNPQKADLSPLQFDYKTSPLHIVDNGHTIMIRYAPGSFLSVNGKRYELQQFHFHRPSEEKIEGRQFGMSLHLVHKNEQGKLAVVAVVLERGRENEAVRELWKNLPKEKEREESPERLEIDVRSLLPSDRGYYMYQGSLTTPPCTENVTWFVLKQPVNVSPSQIEQFSKFYRDDARPPQPVFGRVIQESR